ncbi:YbaY family lipoprotein [Polaromonas sp.]|uniref:YbaY family lipoprotein n=1 Tax=Polaromonas sp. TaxID=1869339 RepID=UPI002FC7A9C6
MKRRMMTMAALGALGLLTACATGPASAPQSSAPAAPAASSGVRVTGSISYLQRVALPPDSDVIVQLRDVSRVDAKADILAEQRFTARSQVPLPFELTVDPGKIDPRMRYAVAARIERGGKLMFINDKLYPVLTQGHGSRVDLILHMVARP